MLATLSLLVTTVNRGTLHACVLLSTCAHGRTKQQRANCTVCPNARRTSISVHSTVRAHSAAQPSRLPNDCDRARHLRDPWLRGPHCLCIGPAPQGLRAACGATCGSAQRKCPTNQRPVRHRITNMTCRRAGEKRGGSDACSACSGSYADHGDMRLSSGCARFEAHDPPAAQPLKRSLNVFRHLQAEDNASRGSEQRRSTLKHPANVPPPVAGVS